ncbi:hypothetical protein EV198_2938 [Roseivirga ehrenbergii]|nr:hypothetical protein EV198_2938 [Roseivirga ehrenbergii]
MKGKFTLHFLTFNFVSQNNKVWFQILIYQMQILVFCIEQMVGVKAFSLILFGETAKR